MPQQIDADQPVGVRIGLQLQLDQLTGTQLPLHQLPWQGRPTQATAHHFHQRQVALGLPELRGTQVFAAGQLLRVGEEGQAAVGVQVGEGAGLQLRQRVGGVADMSHDQFAQLLEGQCRRVARLGKSDAKVCLTLKHHFADIAVHRVANQQVDEGERLIERFEHRDQ
ncbi:hypothetical protein D3C79_767340 [compost metagenome]